MVFTTPHKRTTKAIFISVSTLTQPSGITNKTTIPPSKAQIANNGDDYQNDFLPPGIGELINNDFAFLSVLIL